MSDGTPGQRFALQHRPVLPWSGSSLSVIAGDETTEWSPVDHFGEEDESSRSFHIDPVAGEVVFGPAVREADGSIRQYGKIPAKSASLRMSAYRTGGGKKGNVGIGQIRVLKTSVPYVSRVENRRAAVGGAEAETIDEVKARGPMLLRTRGKAVTAEDFEQLTRDIAPEVARAHCLTAANEREAGVVRVLIVPHVSSDALELVRREDLDPLPETIQRIKTHLNQRRLVGTRLVVEPPAYQRYHRRRDDRLTARLPARAGKKRRAAGVERPAASAQGRAGRHRLADRPRRAGSRGDSRPGQDPGREHGRESHRPAVSGRPFHRATVPRAGRRDPVGAQ